MKKVYCKNCKHYRSEYTNGEYCKVKPCYKYSYYEKLLEYVYCEKRNENNDCKYFEKKEPEPDVIVEDAPKKRKVPKSRWSMILRGNKNDCC